MEEHILSFHETKIFQCNKCNKNFPRNYELQRHIKYVHENGANLQCTYCVRICKTKTRLEQHISSVHFGKRFQCQICAKLYYYKSDMVRHMSKTHEEAKKCSFCSDFFLENAQLEEHISSTHKGKKIESNITNLGLQVSKPPDKLTLDNPVKSSIYEGVKGVQCPHCPKICRSKSRIDQHIASAHLGRKFLCQICLKQYCYKSDVVRHMLKSHKEVAESSNLEQYISSTQKIIIFQLSALPRLETLAPLSLRDLHNLSSLELASCRSL